MARESSTSQKTFRREVTALERMPVMSGKAACEGNSDFDVLCDKDRVSRDVRNRLSRVCAGCGIKEGCGFRQIYSPKP